MLDDLCEGISGALAARGAEGTGVVVVVEQEPAVGRF